MLKWFKAKWLAFWDGGPDLTQSEIDAMNAKGKADMQSGLEKMKIPTTGVEKGKK